jgi:PTS system nitrogen regulatory IIA component
MRLQELIPPEHILLGLEAADKWEVIERMCAHLVARGKLPKAKATGYVEAVLQRERSMSTGMERGIAIPHAAVDGVPEVVSVLGLSRRGVPFDALDRQPARIMVCLIIPRDKKLLHIKTLAEIARLLSRPAVRTRLLEADGKDEVLDIIRQEEGLPR